MDELELSRILITLFQGPVHRQMQEERWQLVLKYQSAVREYVSKLNLTLVLEEGDGYCYLKQDTAMDVPKLASSHQLGFRMSVLLVLLRKRLQEFDQSNHDIHLIVPIQSLQEEMRLFLQDTSDEVKQGKALRAELKKVEEMGLIAKVKGREDEIQVLRIVRSVVDANALVEIMERLQAYSRSEVKEEANEPI